MIIRTIPFYGFIIMVENQLSHRNEHHLPTWLTTYLFLPKLKMESSNKEIA